MGANQWREEEAWPLARARETKYFLHSAGAANSSRGNGTLSTAAPGKETADQFIYDPGNPVPTVGGPLCCDAEHWAPGPRDQRAVEARDDVLVYSTPPLAQDMEVTGPVSVELFAKSSAVDTDFTAKLVDVWPDGFAQNLTEGILRARYRESQESADADYSRAGLQIHDRSMGYQQCFQEGARFAPGDFQQQFSALRSQSEYRRARDRS